MKNLFVEEGKTKIDLRDDLFVEIKAAISEQEFRELIKSEKGDTGLLQKVIVGWNFMDSKGVDMPCNEVNIGKLSSSIAIPLAIEVVKNYMPEKKILMASSEESKEDTPKG